MSRYVLDAALDANLDEALRPARRAAVIRTAAVHKVTTLLVVRYRLEIRLPGSRATLTQVAEEAQFLGLHRHRRPPDLAAPPSRSTRC